MHVKSLQCVSCLKEQPAAAVYRCDSCGGTLDIRYNYEAAFAGNPFARARLSGEGGIWKYRALLPVNAAADPVSLGEGGTPLVSMRRLTAELGHWNVLVKNEAANPTLAFKDRFMSVAVTAAVQYGISRIVAASTGNTAVSASAYAARAGLPCSLYVPEGTPEAKMALAKSFGADVVKVPGTFSDACAAVQQCGGFNVTSTFINPFAIEGNKTVAYELFASLGRAPDWLIIPIGAGPLLVACHKGFHELQMAGLITSVPKLVGVQAERCAPIVRAFNEGSREVQPWTEPCKTLASAIADPLTSYPGDGTRTLGAIRDSGGCAVAVSEEEMAHFTVRLARDEGLIAEPSSAAALAAVKKLKTQNRLKAGELAVCILTAHGIKDLSAFSGVSNR